LQTREIRVRVIRGSGGCFVSRREEESKHHETHFAGVVARQAVYYSLISEREDLAVQYVSSHGVPPMSEVTHILSAIEGGDPHAAEQLLPLVYDELRKLAAQKLAQEKPGQTLDRGDGPGSRGVLAAGRRGQGAALEQPGPLLRRCRQENPR
jgi:hypothetical protein